MAEAQLNVRDEDAGNIVFLEHVNLGIPDQATATLFYVIGLGLTRDPYMNVGLTNMWINVGGQQFHLPTRTAQHLTGEIGIVLPDLDALEQRLESVRQELEGTAFGWSRSNGEVQVTCPWGNQFRCLSSSTVDGAMRLGIPYVEIRVAEGAAEGIGLFYERVMGSPVTLERDGSRTAAIVHIGGVQRLVFRESAEPRPEYDGHHIAVYIANFSGPYGFLREQGLISEDVRNHQFRFQDIVHPDSGNVLCTLEHEVRSLRHPMYRRQLVNRLLD